MDFVFPARKRHRVYCGTPQRVASALVFVFSRSMYWASESLAAITRSSIGIAFLDIIA
jgi:hypothetical protein